MSHVSQTPTTRTRRRWGRGERLPRWALVAAAVVVGVVVGRFVTYSPPDDEAGAPAAAPAVAGAGSTLEDQVASLEANVPADPDDLSSWQALGVAYVRRAVELGDPSYYDQADRAFDRADELSPDAPGTLIGRGAAALSLHDFDRALEIGERLVDLRSDSAEALGVLVDAQGELGRYTEAAATLQDMLDARPGLPALSRTSYLRQLNGDLPGAIDAMARAAVAGTGSAFDRATVIALLGDLRFIAGEPEAALDAHERALAESPDLIEAEVGRAQVLAATGRLDEAAEILEDVVARYPTPGALVLLGDVQVEAGDDEAATDTHELVRAIADLQEDAGQTVDLEMALFEADLGDDPQRAVALARAAYEARPDNVFVADALAWALFRSGDAAGAVPFAEQAVRLGTADPALRYHAAEIYAAVGDTPAAVAEMEAVAGLNPRWSVRHTPAVLELADELGVAIPPPPGR